MNEDRPTTEPHNADAYMCSLTITIPLSVLGMLSHEVVHSGQTPGTIIATALQTLLSRNPIPRETLHATNP